MASDTAANKYKPKHYLSMTIIFLIGLIQPGEANAEIIDSQYAGFTDPQLLEQAETLKDLAANQLDNGACNEAQALLEKAISIYGLQEVSTPRNWPYYTTHNLLNDLALQRSYQQIDCVLPVLQKIMKANSSNYRFAASVYWGGKYFQLQRDQAKSKPHLSRIEKILKIHLDFNIRTWGKVHFLNNYWKFLLGKNLSEQGRYAEALPHIVTAYDFSKWYHGRYDRRRIDLILLLAEIHQNLGQTEHAEKLFRNGLSARLHKNGRLFGIKSKEQLINFNRLRKKLGKPALSKLEIVLPGDEQPKNVPYRQRIRWAGGEKRLYQYIPLMGNSLFYDAEQAHRIAAIASLNSTDLPAIQRAVLLANYGYILDRTGQHQNAKQFHLAAVPGLQNHLGHYAPRTIRARYYAAINQLGLNKPAKALPVITSSCEAFEKALGRLYSLTQLCLEHLADTLKKLGRHKPEESLLRTLISERSERPWDNYVAYNILVPEAFYSRMSAPLYQSDYHGFSWSLPSNHDWSFPPLGILKTKLAKKLEQQKRYDEAEALHREVLVFFEKQWGDRHYWTAFRLENLADNLTLQQRYPDAAILYKRAAHIAQDTLGSKACETENLQIKYRKTLKLIEAQ